MIIQLCLKIVRATIYEKILSVHTVNERDRFSLVTYHSDAYVQFGLIKMTQQGRAIATQAIKVLRCEGETNLCEGLLKGSPMCA